MFRIRSIFRRGGPSTIAKIPLIARLVPVLTYLVAGLLMTGGLAARAFRLGSVDAIQAARAANEDPEPTVAEPLTLTRPRVAIQSDYDHQPDFGTSLGDSIAWFFDHPRVHYVVIGLIEATDTLLLTNGFVYTRCDMKVTRQFKGPPIERISFLVPGGVFRDHASYSSHTTRCIQGTVAAGFLAEDDGVLHAIGNTDLFPVVTRADGTTSNWGTAFANFLATLATPAGVQP